MKGSTGQRARSMLGAMSDEAQKVLEQALALSAEERAKLAHDLIASLDGPSDPDAQAAWAEEIERRVREAKAGGRVGKSWEEVEARIDHDVFGR